MAIVYWYESKERITRSSPPFEPVNFDIHNWRMMREGPFFVKDYEREEIGVYISSEENIRFIPHATIKELMEYNSAGRDHREEKYHLGVRSSTDYLTYCYDCKGVGKFDWIQKASVAMRYPWGEAPKHFVRDESYYYVYPKYKNYLFAKVLLEPGDTYCPTCQGFGIILDGRMKVFKGMVGIKQRLVRIEP